MLRSVYVNGREKMSVFFSFKGVSFSMTVQFDILCGVCRCDLRAYNVLCCVLDAGL